MGIIRLLDEHIANQIAAGEVVERPSSVVKELVENAIDAGGTRIDVAIEEGGLQLVRVSDNGSGMDADDCETAFFRHATSKLASAQQLFEIRTLGFRGEALPSIAAVAKVELLTSPDTSGLGRRIVIEGGTVREKGEARASKGTDIAVRELFYNTPARLKYMKTIQTELGHITDYMYRLAMAYPGIAFTLRHNGHVLLQTLGSGDLLQTIAAIYGTATAKSMLPVEGESLDYRLTGYISKPELTRANRNAVSTIINGRYIRNYGLVQALLQGYHTLLPVHRFPVAVLHLTMDPSLIDVNVHPAKLEVRFSKEPELQQLVERQVRETLGRQRLIPSAAPQPAKVREAVVQEELALYRPQQPTGAAAGDAGALTGAANAQAGTGSRPSQGEGDGQGGRADGYGAPGTPPVAGGGEAWRAGGMGAQGTSPPDTGGGSGAPAAAWGASPARADEARAGYGGVGQRPDAPQGSRSADSAAGALSPERSGFRREDAGAYAARPAAGSRGDYAAAGNGRERAARPQETAAASEALLRSFAGAEPPALPAFPKLHPIGQMHGTYILAQNEEGLFLIDQHAAHERINYEYYFEQFGKPAEASQLLLVPMTLELTSSEALRLTDKLPQLLQAGVELEPFGGSSFLVRSYPHWFPKGEEQAIIEEMIEWLLGERKGVDIARLREKAAIMCSCKASIKANQSMGTLEIETLLDRLAACRNPYTCPHGRPIVVSFSTYELEKMFKRVM